MLSFWWGFGLVWLVLEYFPFSCANGLALDEPPEIGIFALVSI